MKTLKILSVFFLLLVSTAYAQQTGVSGTIIEKATNEPLIGVSVILSNGKGAVTDIAGKFFIAADSGNYTAKISYIGYAPQTVNVTVGKTSSPISVSLEPVTLTEVEIVADVATTRKTPIAFTNIDSKKIEEELAGRDVPMLLATTPGVYGTMQGGGIGDSRVTIRGFDQRNIGVLVDGIPINDMENASVYWSDFDGLPAVTRTIQIQRGLGASKLAIASVGGTINVITKGIEDKKFISYSQEYGSDMLLKETLALSTGKMKGGWGITASGTRKTGDGWVAQTPIQEWAYFVKAEKRFKKHLISASANSAPQIHGQRSWQQPILTYDKKFAAKLGIDTSKNGYLAGTPTGAATPKSYSYGIDYNSHWGNIDRWTGNINPNTGKIIGDTLSHNKSKLNDAVNYFNNPIYNLNDYWNISEKLYLSTVLYASYGTGGGTSLYNNAVPVFASTGQYNFQSVYDNNYTSKWGVNPTIAPGHKSSNFIKSAVNNHVWYGGLMTLTYKLNKNITITTGPDIRWYNGTHYWKVYDLMGGDYALDPSVGNGKTPLRVGDIFNHNYSSYINYEGAFVQSEYVKNKVSAFITATGVETSYQRVDNFDTSSHNKSPIIKFPGYSVKAGANYNIDEHHNVYVNSGYIIKAPPFNNVFYNSNVEEWGVKPQKIASVEAGYGFHTRLIAANLNTYYTS